MREDYPPGPTGLAAMCRDKITELEAERETLPRSERKAINLRLQSCLMLLRFATTRAGYVTAATALKSAPEPGAI
jgi:hypothetical protein